MRDLKLRFLIAWDWAQEHKWFLEIVLLGLVIGLSRFIHELFPYYIMAGIVVIAVEKIIVRTVRTIIIHRKVKKLNEELKREWEERQAFLKSRSQKLKLQYLRGEPVTIVDGKGTVWRVQSGHTNTIISTPN